MPSPEAFLLHKPSAGDVHVVRVAAEGTTSIAVFSARLNSSYSGIASPLFDPSETDSPWRKRDVLVAQTSVEGRSFTRRILRLRRLAGRLVVYRVQTIYEDNGARAIRSLALDPSGRLYFSEEGSPTIYRFQAVPGGVLTANAWATVPAGASWQGDFNFAPDGPLYISTGPGVVPGRLYKFSISGDPEPVVGSPTVESIRWREAYSSVHGPIEGFSFFDGGRLLFASATDAYFGDDIDASLDPTTSGSSGPMAPTIQIPAVAYRPPSQLGLQISDLAVSRDSLQQMLEESGRVREKITWLKRDDRAVEFDDWHSDPETSDLEQKLHRFYAYRVADRRPPLRYRFQIDPLTGSLRTGPETPTPATTIRRDDAVETYLAYLAHFLWMDVKRPASSSGFAGLSDEALSDLLQSRSMFTPYDGSLPHDGDALARGFDYIYNREHLGPVFPSDPYRAFEFITASPVERDDVGDSFLTRGPEDDPVNFQTFRLLDWIRTYLTHHYATPTTSAIDAWGYQGYPPLESIYRRTRRITTSGSTTFVYYSHNGCHAAGGLATHLLRLMLVPARSRRFFLGDSDQPHRSHRGLEVLSSQSLILHMDILYAESWMFSHTGASAAFLTNEHYADWIARFPLLPGTQAELETRHAESWSISADIALRSFSYELLSAFWEYDLPDAVREGTSLDQADGSETRGWLERQFRLDENAARAKYEQQRPYLLGHINQLTEDYGLGAYNGSLSPAERLQLLEQGLARYKSDYVAWKELRSQSLFEWLQARRRGR